MITQEKIKLFAEVSAKKENYDNPAFIKERWYSEEDVVEIKKGLDEEINSLKDDFNDYVLYKMEERQKENIMSVGIEEEIKRLQELKKPHDDKIKGIDSRLEYLMWFFAFDKVETALGKLSYRHSSALWVSEKLNEWLPEELLGLLPAELLKKAADVDLNQEGMEEKLKKIGVEIIPSLGNKNDIKARLKTLDEKELKRVKEFLEIRENRKFKID